MRLRLLLAATLTLTGCISLSTKPPATFGEDVKFLKRHADVVLLHEPGGDAQVAVVPAWQGRVMTSTVGGDSGTSFGWINRRLIAAGDTLPRTNPFGGEDRFWMGPEGGQFALFFPTNAPFNLEHWQTPPVIDTEPFDLAAVSDSRALFRRRATLRNRSGTVFNVEIERTVRVLDAVRIEQALQVPVPASVNVVAFESDNRIINRGPDAWSQSTGLLSIWILGMFTPTPRTTVAIPIETGTDEERGPAVVDTYFGKVPADRLVVRGNVVLFRGDGLYRSKIGIPPRRAKPFMGSYDAEGRVLTLVRYTLPAGATNYVSSLWQVQEAPYGGDAVSSYNHGPVESGKPLGPFYELETSSPAVELSAGASIAHTHQTFHLQGPDADLDAIARATIGVSLETITNAFSAVSAPPEASDDDVEPTQAR